MEFDGGKRNFRVVVSSSAFHFALEQVLGLLAGVVSVVELTVCAFPVSIVEMHLVRFKIKCSSFRTGKFQQTDWLVPTGSNLITEC